LLLPVLIINYFSNRVSLGKISNLFPCEIYINQAINILDNDYQLVRKSISFFPEVENIKCLNKITDIKFLDDIVLIEAVTSFRFVSYFQTLFFLFLLIFIYLSKEKLSKNIIYFGIFSVLLVQEIFFSFTAYNLQFIFVYLFKALLILGLTKSFLDYEINNFEIISYIFLISFCFINIEFLINKDEIFYYGNALFGNNELSSHSTTAHALAYNSLIRFLFPIFNIELKILLDVLLSIWFSLICFKFGKLFNFQNIYLLIYPALLLDYQAGIGGDSIFGAIVPKSFSYLLIFTALYFLCKKNYLIFTLTYGLSFYFHYASSIILSPVIGYIALRTLKTKDLLKSIISGVIIIAPITLNILIGEFGSNSNEIKNQIYKLITVRLPHHFYPFIYEDNKFFEINPYWNNSLLLLLFFLLFVFLSNYLTRKKNFVLKTLVFTSVIIVSYLILIYFFPFSTFVTVHPFRIISLFMVLLITYLLSIANKTNLLLVKTFFITIFLYFNFFVIDQAAVNYYYPEDKTETPSPIINKLNELKPELLIIPAYKQEHMQSPFLDIELRTLIPTYATYKFTPVKISLYNVWENKIQSISNFYSGNCAEFKNYKELYFLDLNENNTCGTIVYHHKDVFIYQLTKNQ
tara:strand:- start:5 stop:1900 length:1896 start_codon:yes stop_codon:yes gene_type:complete